MTGPYSYDLMAASAARGRARMSMLEERQKDLDTPDPPAPKSLHKSKQIVKRLDHHNADASSSRESLTNLNGEFCKPCRRLFEGTGDDAMEIVTPGKAWGRYYAHWDGYFLEKSASLGCSLCLLVYRAHGKARSHLAQGEEVHGQYDFGEFVGSLNSDEKVFAVRFYYYSFLEFEGGMTPK